MAPPSISSAGASRAPARSSKRFASARDWPQAAACESLSSPTPFDESLLMPVTPGATAAATQPSLTAYVADFIASTRSTDVPADVAHLGTRSILDGLGLALAGAASETARIAQRYLSSLGIA